MLLFMFRCFVVGLCILIVGVCLWRFEGLVASCEDVE